MGTRRDIAGIKYADARRHNPLIPKHRFVWVRYSQHVEMRPASGLLIEWRRETQGWTALVVYTIGDDGASTLLGFLPRA